MASFISRQHYIAQFVYGLAVRGSRESVLKPVTWGCTCQSIVAQYRHKGSQRIRAPSVAKEKEKYIPRAVLERIKREEEAVMPPKELEEFMARVPQDNVWIHRYYPPRRCTVAQAVQMHRELGAPEMYDSLGNVVYVKLDLDMTTKKKDKYVSEIRGTVLLPHNFDDELDNRVAVITKNAEDQEKAARLGATFVGGLDLIKKIERGDIKMSDFDHVVLNVDCLTESALIKKHLKDRFPSKKKGNLSTDTEAMVRLFVNGRSFVSEKVTDSKARLTMGIGRLDMDSDVLVSNVKAVVDAVSTMKPVGSGPQLIRTVSVICPPSTEEFIIEDPVLPVTTQQRLPATPTPFSSAASEEADEEDEPEEEEKKKSKVGKAS